MPLNREEINEIMEKTQREYCIEERVYPVSTSNMMLELWYRGYSVNRQQIKHYLSKLKCKPKIIGASRMWTKEDIDALAQHLDNEYLSGRSNVFTPEEQTRIRYGITRDEMREALQSVGKRIGHTDLKPFWVTGVYVEYKEDAIE